MKKIIFLKDHSINGENHNKGDEIKAGDALADELIEQKIVKESKEVKKK